MGPENTDKINTTAQNNLLSEKAETNKLETNDIETLMTNDSHQLVNHLFRLDCLLARAWKQVVEHARSFQADF